MGEGGLLSHCMEHCAGALEWLDETEKTQHSTPALALTNSHHVHSPTHPVIQPPTHPSALLSLSPTQPFTHSLVSSPSPTQSFIHTSALLSTIPH